MEKVAGIGGVFFRARDPRAHGRFARIHDPEGNPIELWQPTGRDAVPSS
jgi:predicted enzyme related to lactoylglutathione lyase